MAGGEVEYESDPEEAKFSLKMRRREASDDEEEEGEKWGDRMEKPPRRIDDLEEESEGAAAEYEEDLEVEKEEYYEEYVEDRELQYGEGAGAEIRDGIEESEVGVVGSTKNIVADSPDQAKTVANEDGRFENNVAGAQVEGQKKEIEPFSVPTAGAFYMHDDRFQDNFRGRHRRMPGGRRLWESKDERKWGHDKFEELTSQERHRGEHKRGSRGRYGGRRRSQGTDRVYTQVDSSKQSSSHGNPSDISNQDSASKGARGRGPRKYQPSFQNYDESWMTNKKLTSENTSNVEPEKMLPRKQVASNLNVASPPFYPTGSSTKDTSMPTRRDPQLVSVNGNEQQSAASKGFVTGQSSGMTRGKSVVDSINVEKLYLDDSSFGVAGRPVSSTHTPVSGSMSSNSHNQLRAQGRGVSLPVQMAYQPVLPSNQVNRSPSSSLLQGSQRNLSHNRSQPPSQSSVQKFPQRLPSGAQASSPPNASGNMDKLEQEELESPPEINQSKKELNTKGKESMQGIAKGSFIYGGAQVIGASGSIGRGYNDQNFPAFLPVMQFGGQHPGGMGVPAVGMAFPGYVSQPQLGIGSSEMTWLPVLAGAAGAFGAAYCPPYITADGSYNARASGSASSHSLSKENNGEKPSNEWMPAQNAELPAEEVGQRQKNPRRYTEMKFDK